MKFSVKLCLFGLLNETSWDSRAICLFLILQEGETKEEKYPGDKVEVVSNVSNQTRPQMIGKSCKYILD